MMTRDYSSRGNQGRGKTRASANRNRSRAAGKRRAPKKNARKQAGTPSWVWFACSLCIGLTVAAFVYIITRPTSHPGRDFARIEVPQSAAANNANASVNASVSDAEAGKQSPAPNFAFYEMLPDYEIVVPRQDYPEKTGDSDGAAGTQEAAEPQPATPAASPPERYIFQAGSFSSLEDASRRRAELILLGMHAKVVESRLDSGEVVYRVRSGIIESDDRLTTLLQRLREKGIGTLVLRRSG